MVPRVQDELVGREGMRRTAMAQLSSQRSLPREVFRLGSVGKIVDVEMLSLALQFDRSNHCYDCWTMMGIDDRNGD